MKNIEETELYFSVINRDAGSSWKSLSFFLTLIMAGFDEFAGRTPSSQPFNMSSLMLNIGQIKQLSNQPGEKKPHTKYNTASSIPSIIKQTA